MQRKKRRDHRARPASVCCSQEKPEKKQRVRCMNHCVHEQMPTSNRAEELAVDHMCNPCEWMPIARVKSGKRPGESAEGNTAIHHWVPLDIRNVIDHDEAMPYQLLVDPKRHYRQTEQDDKVGSLKCHGSACVSLAIARNTGSPVGCAKPGSLSLLRRPFIHAVCET